MYMYTCIVLAAQHISPSNVHLKIFYQKQENFVHS